MGANPTLGPLDEAVDGKHITSWSLKKGARKGCLGPRAPSFFHG